MPWGLVSLTILNSAEGPRHSVNVLLQVSTAVPPLDDDAAVGCCGSSVGMPVGVLTRNGSLVKVTIGVTVGGCVAVAATVGGTGVFVGTAA